MFCRSGESMGPYVRPSLKTSEKINSDIQNLIIKSDAQ